MSEFLLFVTAGLVTGSVYGLAGVGLTLTYRTSGIFNFAHGAVAAGVAAVFYKLRVEWDVPWGWAMALCLLVVGPLLGLLLERMARTLTNAQVVTRIVATLGVLVLIQQLIIIEYGGATLNFEPYFPTEAHDIAGVFVGEDQMITMAIGLVATAGLYVFLQRTRLGVSMRGVVDNTNLLGMTGTSPTAVRRIAWCIGASFAGLSGVLIAPTIGLDAPILTLLVIQAFGAAAVGLFRSLPLTYAGGLLIGVLQALIGRYVEGESFLGLDLGFLDGLSTSLPFFVLFGVLLVAPRRRLVDVGLERKRAVVRRSPPPLPVLAGLAGAGLVVLLLVPTFAGAKLIIYTLALAYVVVFLSLALLERTSGQASLAQLAFVAVGGCTLGNLMSDTGLPWLLAALLGALVAVPVGALLAIPAIRLSGLYLGLATMGFGLVMQNMIYGSPLMFGESGDAIATPRPGFAEGDKAYYYFVLVVVVLAAAAVVAVRRSRLGRLLRAMSDSPTALSTGGTSVTAVKVFAFCISAFLAGLAGTLIGPVTGSLAAADYAVFASLLLVVVLALQGPLPEIPASFAAPVALFIIPAYITSDTFNEWLYVIFGLAAILVAMFQATAGEGHAAGRGPDPADLHDRIGRTPARERRLLAAQSSPVGG